MTTNYGKRQNDWKNWQNWENWQKSWSSKQTERRAENDKRSNQGRRWDDQE